MCTTDIISNKADGATKSLEKHAAHENEMRKIEHFANWPIWKFIIPKSLYSCQDSFNCSVSWNVSRERSLVRYHREVKAQLVQLTPFSVSATVKNLKRTHLVDFLTRQKNRKEEAENLIFVRRKNEEELGVRAKLNSSSVVDVHRRPNLVCQPVAEVETRGQRVVSFYAITKSIDRMSLLRMIGGGISFLLLSIMAIVESIVRMFIPLKYKMKDISGEVALVTGGAGGLGRLLALRLANLDAIVVVWDIDKNGVEETVKLVQAAGGTCYGYVCDLCDREDVYKKAAQLREEVGKVSILINNAGVAIGMKLVDTPDKLIIRTMDVNIMSHFWTVKAFLPAMMESNKGHIVSIASMAGYVGIPKLVDYCTSKFAAVGFDEALRMELEADGYNINTTVICPYFIRSTGMFGDVDSRFLSALSPNEVADRVIVAMRCNEKYALLPGYFQTLLSLKWLFPWTCIAMVLRGLVRDAAPSHGSITGTLTSNEKPNISIKDQNGGVIHERLTRRISSSERKP
ncbi:hypothetical protein KPH14_006720 [Odynerus spinipes]|uniref:Uncharacterized protein n=1 Tax=Odynerus spinipes TaxID=1348599 RepID=A0AAD9VRP4_9HYME|nr:hypothetical protein KPH14_006720 [Odynerus spinipes]